MYGTNLYVLFYSFSNVATGTRGPTTQRGKIKTVRVTAFVLIFKGVLLASTSKNTIPALEKLNFPAFNVCWVTECLIQRRFIEPNTLGEGTYPTSFDLHDLL